MGASSAGPAAIVRECMFRLLGREGGTERGRGSFEGSHVSMVRYSGRGRCRGERGRHGNECCLVECGVIGEVAAVCHASVQKRKQRRGTEGKKSGCYAPNCPKRPQREHSRRASLGEYYDHCLREDAGSSKRLEGVTRLMRLAVDAARNAWWRRQ